MQNIKITKPGLRQVLLPIHELVELYKTTEVYKAMGQLKMFGAYPTKFLSMEIKANLGKPPEIRKSPKFREPGLCCNDFELRNLIPM